ncbi:PREDICTED: egg cell-secreted protein 1.4-like [Nelumbo nucifera]|uniref:Egg cell-secreted protein 1.4-like n=2 Tax=Nelumbo nucifera TaxID=4432 RepID=A0A1U8A4I2_NELNU|nr:PREDICTED: egg cell-secreted protein 1.4-like [Nelumbo nucifera]DAD40075.1 TPA_asm: hypothetical protein HUJ06_014398 [Nelumbo nucifera]
MAVRKLALLLVIVAWVMGTTATVAARELPLTWGHDLAARLESEGGGLVECGNALLELRACTNEIILFFLEGETYLGLDCCRAIRIITRQCWPSMFTSIGFTAEQGDILRGYCDASMGTLASPPPPYIGPVPPVEPPVLSPTQTPLSPTPAGVMVVG